MTVASRQNGHAEALGGENRLNEALQVPSHHEHGIEATFCEPPAELRRVAAAKSAQRPGFLATLWRNTCS